MTFKATTILIAALLALAALPTSARAEDGADNRIPITDPALLERLGFAPDVTNVYATEQALRSMSLTPAERAAAEEADLAADRQSVFGTSSSGYSAVSGTEFFPESAAEDPDFGRDDRYATSLEGRYCLEGNHFYVAQVHSLPHGAKVDQARAWVYDDFSEDMTVSLVRTCQPSGAGQPTRVTLASSSTSGTGGNKRLLLGDNCQSPGPPCPIDEDVDNQHCVYELRVVFPSAFGPTCIGDANLRIQKVRVEWRRQVSPAPDTATFGDVPTSHLFFQQIEALAASGITGGCGGGDYCPGGPVTRGQMAAFLAKALGLHWTDISQ